MSSFGFAPLTHEPSTAVKLAAAGVGGCLAESATFPLDTAKVRLMVQGEGATRQNVAKAGVSTTRPVYRGLFSTIAVISKTEGPKSLYSGLTAGCHRQLVVGSVRIGLYDAAKTFFGKHIDGEAVDIHHASLTTRICAGITTGIMAISIGQPTDVVKIRMQAQGASGVIRYTGAMSAYGKIISEDGVRGLWRGLSPNMMRTAVVNAAEIVSYDVIKTSLVRKELMSDNAPCHLVSALGAALITTIVSSPVDVIKTRYMNSYTGQYSGLVDCAVSLYKEKGFASFYKGCVPSFWRMSSWNIVMFTSYEQLKRGFSHAGEKIDLWQAQKLTAREKWE